MSIKVLLVDDEDAMRLLIKKVLNKFTEFEIVGEACNGKEALEIFLEKKPEIVFMDVEMEIMSGIECGNLLIDIDPKVKIIFATAHSQYMPDAFRLYAFDYLIKPFKIDRLIQTLNRIKNINNPVDEIDRMLKYEKGLNRLIIKSKDGMSFVDTDDIILIQRENSSTVIYTEKESYTTSASLSEIEEKLDYKQFIRSHKSYIINISKITKIYPYGRWTYIVKLMSTEKDALITHEKYEEIKKIFNL